MAEQMSAGVARARAAQKLERYQKRLARMQQKLVEAMNELAVAGAGDGGPPAILSPVAGAEASVLRHLVSHRAARNLHRLTESCRQLSRATVRLESMLTSMGTAMGLAAVGNGFQGGGYGTLGAGATPEINPAAALLSLLQSGGGQPAGAPPAAAQVPPAATAEAGATGGVGAALGPLLQQLAGGQGGNRMQQLSALLSSPLVQQFFGSAK